MKRFLLILLLTTMNITAQAQEIERVKIKGDIVAPDGQDAEGVVIMNTNTGRATISNEDGKFTLEAGINDELVLQSLQFSKVRILVDYGIITTKGITVTLSDTITQLREVVVRPYDLSGNVVADVNVIPTQKQVMPKVNVATIVMEDRLYDRYSPVDNVAMDDEQWRYGLNFVNIFRALVGKKNSSDKNFKETASAEIKAMYDDDFFSRTLKIKPAEIESFIDYTLDNGLDKQMLNPGNELDLISFLLDQSRAFNSR